MLKHSFSLSECGLNSNLYLNSNMFVCFRNRIEKEKRTQPKPKTGKKTQNPVSSRGPTPASGPARTPFPPSPLCARPVAFQPAQPSSTAQPSRAHGPPHPLPITRSAHLFPETAQLAPFSPRASLRPTAWAHLSASSPSPAPPAA